MLTFGGCAADGARLSAHNLAMKTNVVEPGSLFVLIRNHTRRLSPAPKV